jgi:ubiquinone/menaquinone biosynthesis C-methylase UbiE
VVGYPVVGIDISSRALSVALESRGGDLFPRFLEADALAMSFRSSSFDVVFCGGAIAWMKDRHQAISESCRVMCLWGTLVVIPFFYREEPLDELIANFNRLPGRNCSTIWILRDISPNALRHEWLTRRRLSSISHL